MISIVKYLYEVDFIGAAKKGVGWLGQFGKKLGDQRFERINPGGITPAENLATYKADTAQKIAKTLIAAKANKK